MRNPPDVFTAMDVIGDYIENGCIQHKTYYSGICPVCSAIRRDARAGLAEIRRMIGLLANDTTAADLRQEIEFMPLVAREQAFKYPEGDPAEVHPADSRAESQSGLNGPSGSPASPSGRDAAESDRTP